jgi:2-polyprenyl-6-methoxyphenol hydroxylase-like FAD-dependent oxidoreductase
MPRPRVLIAGASIAGPALAFWLGRSGWDVTVVERAPAFRDGGQNVDVRGAGREVLRRAGLEQAVRDASTGERGTRFVDDGGRTIPEFPVVASDTDGATAEVEVLRGDLARILVDATADTGPGASPRLPTRSTCPTTGSWSAPIRPSDGDPIE